VNFIARLAERSRRHRTRRPLPFFAMLERRGVTYAELENAIGAHALPRAMRRCTDCGARYVCGWRNAGCPNGGLFEAALIKKSIPAA